MKVEHVDGSNINLHPTNSCFDDALEFLGEEAKRNPMLVGSGFYTLVHGILTHSEEGYQYSHAWIETIKGRVLHSGFLNGMFAMCEFEKDEYYKEMGLVACTRYSVWEAQFMNHKHVNYGPWEERYLKLCRNYKDIKSGKSIHSVEKKTSRKK